MRQWYGVRGLCACTIYASGTAALTAAHTLTATATVAPSTITAIAAILTILPRLGPPVT
jgi:hypothetical protein